MVDTTHGKACQLQVVRLLRDGHTQAQIAQALDVSAATSSRDVQVLLRHGLLVRPYLR